MNFTNQRTLLLLVAMIFAVVLLSILVATLNPKEPDWVTATVEKGDVVEIVSMSGFIEAKNTADLAFPSSGKVTEVFVTEGQQVTQGEVLTTLAAKQLVAQRNDATAQLRIAQAKYDQLIAGESTETKAIAEINLHNAEQNLARTISQEQEKVDNAKKTLLSSGLTALSQDSNISANAPTITGSYECAQDGTYTIQFYRSNAYTGYSYRLSGLETITMVASTIQPVPLGKCGLYIQLTAGANYNNSTWIIDIPNKRNSAYVTNANAYALALENQKNVIAAAQETETLTAQETAEIHSGPRNEEVRTALAEIDQAYAKIAQIDAQIDDRSIIAPFDGIITDVSILTGETASLNPVITILATDAFELKARVPEIDITKIEVDQQVETTFDAKAQETYSGKISYISPLATIIDGVAYFEATISLDTIPKWIRSGLNADVDIVINKKENVLRIPKRFLIENDDGTQAVFVKNGTKTATTTVTVYTIGNDGFAEIAGISEGQIIIAP